MSNPLSIRARKKVKAELEKAEKERLLALFQRRMELARNGAMLFKEGKFQEALNNYYAYIEILEKTKQVRPGELSPRHFDPRKDVAELLLLSGVYWDLAKIHDRAGKKTRAKLETFINQFVLFSQGMPYQHVSAEIVRKFLVNGMPRHRKEFKDAHIRLGGNKCFIASAVEEFCEPTTVPSLRQFRDERLLTNAAGRMFVKTYYAIGPSLARMVLRFPIRFQQWLGDGISWIARRLQA